MDSHSVTHMGQAIIISATLAWCVIIIGIVWPALNQWLDGRKDHDE